MTAEPQPSTRRLKWQVFATAFAVRVLYILIAHTYKVRPSDDHFEFAWEMGRTARALVSGYGYSDAFNGYVAHTGPTAWTPPLYTLLIAGVFKLFGIYTKASAFVLLTINSLFGAWTATLLYDIGQRCFNRRVAVWSAWLWALYPAAMQYDVRWIWEMSATAAVFPLILLHTLRMRGIGEDAPQQGTRDWIAFGLLWGVQALLNPTPLILLPVCAAYALFAADGNAPSWMLTVTRKGGTRAVTAIPSRRRLAHATLAAAMFIAMLAPWTARNWGVFHQFIPLRDDFGAENFEGNSDWSTGFSWGRTVPLENKRILAEYTAMGEAAWVADRGVKADAWIHSHPARFAQLSIKRAWMYWAGVPKSVEEAGVLEYARLISFQFLSVAGVFGAVLCVRRRLPGSLIFAAAFLLLPLPYYTVVVQARFRHVLEPLICLLGVFLFQSAVRRQANRSEVG